MLRCIRAIDNLIDALIAIVLLIILMVGIYLITDSAYVYQNASNDKIRKMQVTHENVETVLKEMTDDAVAWLSLDNTSINYPIMQADDNVKYLNKDPYGDYSLAGSIFLDFRNSPTFSDPYMIVYGHHMINGLMFGALDEYEDEKYFDEHRTGKLMIDGMEYGLNIFAFAVMDAQDITIFDPTVEPYDIHEYIVGKTKIYREPYGNPILALTTCRDPGLTTRTIVFTEIVDLDEIS